MNAQKVIRAIKTPITLIVLVAFVAWAAQWAYTAARAPIPPRPPQPCVVTQVGEYLTPDRVFVRVLNGTDKSGVAKRLAAFLRADGFRTFYIANTDELTAQPTVDPTAEEQPADDVRHPLSEVVGHSEDSPEVILVRQAFVDISFRADGRVDRTVDVIIGAAQPVPNPNPVFDAPLPDGTACLPQITIVNSDG